MIFWFQNLKFRYKLLAGMTAITTLALLLITQLSYTYFYRRSTSEVLTKARYSVQMSSSTLQNQLTSLAASTNLLLVKAPFPEMISDINYDRFGGYSKYFSEAAAETASFLQNHEMVNNLLLCGEGGILFSPSYIGPNMDIDKLFPENIWNYPRIAVLSARYNPLFKQGSTIPVSYPVSARSGAKTVTYQDMEGCKKARFVVLLDTSQIHAYFDRMSNGYTACMYLADSRGKPLDITEVQYPEAFFQNVTDWVAGSGGFTENRLAVADDELFITADSVGFCDLKVVHITRKSALTGDIRELQTFFIFVWLICTLAAALLAFALSRLLTRNLRVLGRIIGQINDSHYENKVVFEGSDEISLLGTQLNQMYDTIQLQLERIKEEEQKKARAEIQMMSEQINPHFLYNTLECIHFQIMNGHSRTAGQMVESLGRYLRITLSVGKALIPLEKEVEHVTAYMEIMNRHSSNGIRFICHIEPALRDYKIVKVILQPLAENCIKHGFGGSVTGLEPVPPQITISITLEPESVIKIQVSDNGKGIDVPRAMACLVPNEPETCGHFGLHNIYKRLKACYGDGADMAFSSIPYLENSVIVMIPYDE